MPEHSYSLVNGNIFVQKGDFDVVVELALG
jgi:hypothetical protein